MSAVESKEASGVVDVVSICSLQCLQSVQNKESPGGVVDVVSVCSVCSVCSGEWCEPWWCQLEVTCSLFTVWTPALLPLLGPSERCRGCTTQDIQQLQYHTVSHTDNISHSEHSCSDTQPPPWPYTQMSAWGTSSSWRRSTWRSSPRT